LSSSRRFPVLSGVCPHSFGSGSFPCRRPPAHLCPSSAPSSTGRAEEHLPELVARAQVAQKRDRAGATLGKFHFGPAVRDSSSAGTKLEKLHFRMSVIPTQPYDGLQLHAHPPPRVERRERHVEAITPTVTLSAHISISFPDLIIRVNARQTTSNGSRTLFPHLVDHVRRWRENCWSVHRCDNLPTQ